MKQSKTPVQILVYGVKNFKAVEALGYQPIDVMQAGWAKLVAPGQNVRCHPNAYNIAKKTIRRESLVLTSRTILREDPVIQEARKEEPTNPDNKDTKAIKVGEVLVSNEYNPAVRTSRIWLNTGHLEVIKKLLGEGAFIELLDENGRMIGSYRGKVNDK